MVTACERGEDSVHLQTMLPTVGMGGDLAELAHSQLFVPATRCGSVNCVHTWPGRCMPFISGIRLFLNKHGTAVPHAVQHLPMVVNGSLLVGVLSALRPFCIVKWCTPLLVRCTALPAYVITCQTSF